MKKSVFLFLAAFQASQLFAQIYVDGVKITPDNTGQYIELDPMYKTDGSCTFSVDYGQSNPKEDYISDEYGKQVEFRSLVAGLNYFYAQGWEVLQTTVQERSGRRFLLKRRF
jgi:hypothetical protein